jgi:hypothetical protein
MGVEHTLLRNSGSFKGLDLKSSDIDRTIEFASDMRNASYRNSGAINKRKGYHITQEHADNAYGLFTYKKLNATTGDLDDEMLMVNKQLHRVIENKFTITRPALATISNLFDLTLSGVVSKTNDVYTLIYPLSEPTLTVGGLVYMDNETDRLLEVIEISSELERDPTTNTGYINVKKVKLQIVDSALPSTLLDNPTAGSHSINAKNENVEVYMVLDEELETPQFRFKIRDIVTDKILVNELVGDSTGGMSLYDLASKVNNVFGLDCTYTDTDDVAISEQESGLAALLDIIAAYPVNAGDTVTFPSREWEVVHDGSNSDTATVFTAYDKTDSNSIVDKSNLENANSVSINNVMYFSNGVDPIMKYDGSKVYRAGLPVQTTPITTSSSGTPSNNSSGTKYFYICVLKYQDAQGNIIYSQPSAPVGGTSVDTAYDLDWSSSFSFTGLDTSSTYTSYTPEIGTNSSLKKLRMLVYRTSNGATQELDNYYLVGDVGYDESFTDNAVADISSNALLVQPQQRRDPPPVGKYMTLHKNCVAVAGMSDDLNTVYYSQAFYDNITFEIGSEYFPADINYELVESSFGDRITALASLRDLLYVFHEGSIHVIAGEINDPTAVPMVDILTREGNIGCVSHGSIQETNNNILFLSKVGLFLINSSNALTEASASIRPIFEEEGYNFKRATTVNWTSERSVIIHIPKEDTSVGAVDPITYTQDGSLILVFDYFRGAWLRWDSLNTSGGLTKYNDKIFFASRDAYSSKLNNFNDTESKYDYADNTDTINMFYETNWESLNEATIPKKFLRVKLYSLDTIEDFESPKFKLLVEVQKNYLYSDLGAIEFDFGQGAALGWGEHEWGKEPWGNATLDFLKSKLPTGKAKSLKLRFSNNELNTNILLTKYELEIARPYRAEIKD